MTNETRAGSDGGRPGVEWVVGAASAILVACLVLYLGYRAIFGDTRPPDILVTVEHINQFDNGTVVMVAVANRGGEAASAVTVTALTPNASGQASHKQIKFDYIAAQAVRRGAFVFPGAIEADRVQVEIGGYTEP